MRLIKRLLNLFNMDYQIDAKGKTLGRLASKIAYLLQGKDNPEFEGRRVGSNRVIVKNVSGLKVTGKKATQKTYYRHTGYMGHLKSKTFKEAFQASPEWVLRHAVSGMLPRNSLKVKRLKRLIFEK